MTGSAWQGTVQTLGEGPNPLLVSAIDAAGNTTQATRDIVLDLFPPAVEGALVSVGEETAVTDAVGRYAIPSSEAQSLVQVSLAGMTAVERRVAVASGVGTVPVDARLTSRAPGQTLGPGGGALLPPTERALHVADTLVRVVVPSGALGADTELHLTVGCLWELASGKGGV